MWEKVTEEFNQITEQNHERLYLTKRYNNFRQILKKESEEPNEENQNISDSEIDVVNSSTLENRKLKHQFENEFLTNLVNKYDLHLRSPFDSSRSAIWHDILREFNEGTSNNFDKKTLQKRWTNRFKWSDQSMLGPEHGKMKGYPHDKIVEEILSPNNMSTKQMMFFDNENPWFVENLEEFLYYCCPECDLSRESIFQSRELFLEHALETHPKAKSYLLDSTDTGINIFHENRNFSGIDSKILKLF